MKNRTPLAVHVTGADLAAMEGVLDRVANISRHALVVAAIRAGLELFTNDPAAVLPHVAGDRAASRIRVRAI